MVDVVRKYGWRPDVADQRDHYFSLPTVEAALPARVDILGNGNPIDDQGQAGSCTGNASTACLEIGTGIGELSRLMAYYNGRALEGTTREDSGCMIRDVIKGLTKNGVCTETLWPYNLRKLTVRPTKKCYTTGVKIISPLVASYQRLSYLLEVKTALAAGMPVIFGFSVPQFFESQDVATSGWVRLPTNSDPMIGGHAVLAVGYDDAPTSGPFPFVWVRNSWGASWGVNGYFRMDQTWFSDPRRLVDDMWVIHFKK